MSGKDKRKEFKELREIFKKNFVLTFSQVENEGISTNLKGNVKGMKTQMLSPSFFQSIGHYKLDESRDIKRIRQLCVNFLTKILEQESEAKNTSDLNLKLMDVHKYAYLRNMLTVSSFTLVAPLIFILKWSSMKSMGFFRYLFMLPLLYSHFYIKEVVRNYATHEESLFMLFVLEKNYKDNKEIYEKYKQFMKENHLEFTKLH